MNYQMSARKSAIDELLNAEPKRIKDWIEGVAEAQRHALTKSDHDNANWSKVQAPAFEKTMEKEHVTSLPGGRRSSNEVMNEIGEANEERRERIARELSLDDVIDALRDGTLKRNRKFSDAQRGNHDESKKRPRRSGRMLPITNSRTRDSPDL